LCWRSDSVPPTTHYSPLTTHHSPPTTHHSPSLARSALDVGGQPLSHLDFGSMVDRPRSLMRDRLDEPGGRRMAVAALLDAAEGQMNFRADAGQIHVTHAIFAFVAEQPHGPVIFGDDSHG